MTTCGTTRAVRAALARAPLGAARCPAVRDLIAAQEAEIMNPAAIYAHSGQPRLRHRERVTMRTYTYAPGDIPKVISRAGDGNAQVDRALPTADTDGDWEEMPWLAGQGVGLIHDIRPAKDVVETMMADAKAILKRLSVSL